MFYSVEKGNGRKPEHASQVVKRKYSCQPKTHDEVEDEKVGGKSLSLTHFAMETFLPP